MYMFYHRFLDNSHFFKATAGISDQGIAVGCASQTMPNLTSNTVAMATLWTFCPERVTIPRWMQSQPMEVSRQQVDAPSQCAPPS